MVNKSDEKDFTVVMPFFMVNLRCEFIQLTAHIIKKGVLLEI